ncbi:MAG: T9SS type A sorting domain-containing protein, partial [Bacteroidales bacterium]|nr:T9SS type A sorting domain-containing protein [Bacteroidales bacterium]
LSFTDTSTSIQCRHKIDTVLYLVVPENQYSIYFENSSDTDYLHMDTSVFYFRDCFGLRLHLYGNCEDSAINIQLTYSFPSKRQRISDVFYPTYRKLFVNFNERNYDYKGLMQILFLCYEPFGLTVNRFFQRVRFNGFDCLLVTVDSTWSVDSLQQIVQSYYEMNQTDFLILVGDYQHIKSYDMDEGLSDLRYGMIKGLDDFPEMIVGRIAGNDTDEIALQIDKILSPPLLYPLPPKKAIGIASDSYSNLTGMYDWEYMRNIRNKLMNRDYEKVYEFYEGSQREEDSEGNPLPDDIIAAVNQGVSLINYLGYGSYDTWETGGINNNELLKLENTTQFPNIFSSACLDGHFAGRRCLAEQWMNVSYRSRNQACGARSALMFSSLIDWDAAIYAQQLFNDLVPADKENIMLGDMYLQVYVQMLCSLQRSKDALSLIFFGFPSEWFYPISRVNVVQMDTTDILVYPNPSQQQLNIQNKNGLIKEVKLFDLHGKTVKEQSIHNTHGILFMDDLPSGMYVLKIICDKGESLYKKIVKQ